MTLNKILFWLIVGGLLLLTITPLIVSTSLFFPFITGKGFFFRMVMEIILALWIILALRDPNYRPRLLGGQTRGSWLLVAMSSLLLVLALATAWGANPFRSFWSNFERMEGLISYLHLFAYFLILISVLKKEKLWAWFSHSLLVINAVIAVYSVLQLTGKLAINQGGVRLDATFGNATYLAVYALFHLFLLLFCLIRFWQENRWQSTNWRSWWRTLVAGYVLLGLFNLVLLYKTATRGAILGLGLGLIISAILIIWRERTVSGKTIRRVAWGTLGLAVLAIVGFLAVKNTDWVAKSPTLSRFASISVDDRTTQSRFLVWNMSWRGFKERPLLGWGPENYILVFNKYYDPEMYPQEPWFDRSHNVVFDWLISAGALGLLAYLSLFVAALYLLWWQKGVLFSVAERALFTGLLVAYFFHNLFVFDNLVSYLLFLATLGYIHFRSTEINPPISIREIPRTDKQWPLGSVIVVVVILFIPTLYWINFKPLSANRALIEALSWQKYPDKALENFKRVFAYQTFASTEASEHFLNSALSTAQDESIPADTRTGILTLAQGQILETIKREPENARYRLFAGSFFSRVGLLAEAEKELLEARRLAPRKQAILFELGGFYINQKKYDEALALFREAYESAPDFNEARKIYALGAVYDKQLSLAADLLSAGAENDPVFLLDERLVQAYGAINQSNALVGLWKKAVTDNPKFDQPLSNFLADLKKQGIIK